MTATVNLFADLPTDLSEEVLTTLLEADGVRIERIVSQGQSSPAGFWYDQPRREWVVVLRGRARLRFEDGDVELKPGDCVDIPARKRHRVEWTATDEPTIWLAIHFGPES
jgi:cupin 2 domain-containing protein